MFKSFQMLSLLEYSVWGSNINEDNNIQPAVYVTEYIPSHMIGHNCLLEKLIHPNPRQPPPTHPGQTPRRSRA